MEIKHYIFMFKVSLGNFWQKKYSQYFLTNNKLDVYAIKRTFFQVSIVLLLQSLGLCTPELFFPAITLHINIYFKAHFHHEYFHTEGGDYAAKTKHFFRDQVVFLVTVILQFMCCNFPGKHTNFFTLFRPSAAPRRVTHHPEQLFAVRGIGWGVYRGNSSSQYLYQLHFFLWLFFVSLLSMGRRHILVFPFL